MAIPKPITLALTACAVAGWLVVTGLPAEAVVHPTAGAGHPAPTCTYRVVHVRPGSFLNVRRGPGTRFRPIGRLRVADGRFTGACRSDRGWVALRSSGGKRGWASAHYLRKVTGK